MAKTQKQGHHKPYGPKMAHPRIARSKEHRHRSPWVLDEAKRKVYDAKYGKKSWSNGTKRDAKGKELICSGFVTIAAIRAVDWDAFWYEDGISDAEKSALWVLVPEGEEDRVPFLDFHEHFLNS